MNQSENLIYNQLSQIMAQFLIMLLMIFIEKDLLPINKIQIKVLELITNL